MSILIKGMEMPKAGNWITVRIYYEGTCAEPNWQGDCRYMKGCEAVPVPPHGRLIDADALPRFGGRKGLIHASDVDAAPTIIEAEVKE